MAARADVEPGGLIREASLVARDGEDVADADVEPDSGMARALVLWLDQLSRASPLVLTAAGFGGFVRHRLSVSSDITRAGSTPVM